MKAKIKLKIDMENTPNFIPGEENGVIAVQIIEISDKEEPIVQAMTLDHVQQDLINDYISVITEEVVPNKQIFWTTQYNPFTIGGNTPQAVGCELECKGPIKLGKGYWGYVHDSAKLIGRKKLVCEAYTGTIVGHSIEMVKENIAEGEKEVMENQIKQAKKLKQNLTIVSEDEFFGLINNVIK